MAEQPPRRSAEAALLATGVGKSFGGVRALADVDLQIDRGEIHALVGENGSGKSTFIKILSGYHEPDAGSSVVVDGVQLSFGSSHASRLAGCRFVHQDLGLVGSCSVIDNFFFTTGFPKRFGSIDSKRARLIARAALERVGLDLNLDAPVSSLSPAEKTGMVVARALRDDDGVPAHLLVLDEPTAKLDGTDVARLLDIVRSVAASGVGVLYVSHRLEEVLTVARNVTVLRDGKKVATVPTNSLDRDGLVHLLLGEEVDSVRIAAQALVRDEAAAPILTVEDLQSAGVAHASFTCRPSEIVGITGILGSGAGDLLPALFGATPRFAGKVLIDSNVVPASRPDLSLAMHMAYLPEDRQTSSGVMGMGTHENLTLAGLSPVWGRVGWRRGAQMRETRSWFDRLSVSPAPGLRKLLNTFSGGNQQKVLLAKWLRVEPRVLLLDEPTHGVDVGARAVLHAEIVRAAERGAAVVCHSTDADELVTLCHRVLVMIDGRIGAVLEGEDVTISNISRASLGAPQLAKAPS